MTQFFINQKFWVVLGAAILATAGYIQGTHIATWGQLFQFTNLWGWLAVLAALFGANHASSLFVTTGSGSTQPPK